MSSFFQTLSQQFRKTLGHPVELETWFKTYGYLADGTLNPKGARLKEEHAKEKHVKEEHIKEDQVKNGNIKKSMENVAEGSIIAWHRFGQNASLYEIEQNRGVLRGWRMQHGEWAFSLQHRAEFEKWQIESQTKISLDIQNIDGLSSSKSNLRDYKSLDDFAEDRCPTLIEQVNQDGLNQALNHSEIRILHSPKGGDALSLYTWDGRIFLSNQGGSHHFAAARYLAARLGTEVPIEGTLKIHGISPDAVTSLQHDFSMFIMEDKAESIHAFEEAMRSFKAGYYWMEMPSPHQDKRALFLPTDDVQSQKVACMLEQHHFLNLGKQFQHLLALQEKNNDCLNQVFLCQQKQKRFDELKISTYQVEVELEQYNKLDALDEKLNPEQTNSEQTTNQIHENQHDPLNLRGQLSMRLQQRKEEKNSTINPAPPSKLNS